MNVSRCWVDFYPPDRPAPIADDDPHGSEIDRPDTLLLLPIFDIRDAVRPRRNYERDDIVGEPGYVLHPRLDPESGKVYDDRGDDISDTNRGVLVPSGRSLRFRRLQSGLPAIEGGSTVTPEADPNGLSGGTDAPADPQAREWKIETPELIITVQARTRKEAKKKGKAVLSIPMGEPFPVGTRIRAVG